MIRKKLPLIFGLLLIFIFINPTNILAFSDLGKHWSSEYVMNLSSKEIISGYSDGTFRPDDSITRAEFYKVINSMAKYNKTYAVSFADVKKTDWYYDEVAKGIKAGYITPTTGNLYPDKPISREEAMRIIGYAYKLEEKPEAINVFDDKDTVKIEAKGYIGTLVSMKIIEGFPDGHFYPKKEITRGEISKILNSCINDLGMPENAYLVDSEIKFGPRAMYD